MFYLNENNPSDYEFYKESKNCKIWQVDERDSIGKLLITFDKYKIYNLWTDYPDKFTIKQIELIRKELPFWYDFFNDRIK